MTRTVQSIRLLAAVAVTIAACWFVQTYDGASRVRFQFDHPRETLVGTPLGRFIVDYGAYAYALPLAALPIGGLAIWRRPYSGALIEAIVSILWVLAFVWAGLVLVIWQFQNIPVFYGGQLHY